MSKFQVRKNTTSDLSRLSARSNQRTMTFNLVEFKKDMSVKQQLTTVIYVSENNSSIYIKNEKWNLDLKINCELGFKHDIPTFTKNGVKHTNIEVLENVIELASKSYTIFDNTMGADWIYVAFDCYYKVKARAKSACSFEVVENTLQDWIDAISFYADSVKDDTKMMEVVDTLCNTGIFSTREIEQMRDHFTPVVSKLPITLTPVIEETTQPVVVADPAPIDEQTAEVTAMPVTLTMSNEVNKGKKKQPKKVTQPVTGV